ncbi:hypothetical protein PYDG_00048 [Pseudoalteromonas phage pYD6-A]|uniref:Uncharacterized protein n=1 Tax=Pseudoalteromonas phage pYD6-A TaxID=754052 RepID=M4T3X7_9CAUD|nr:hypothetical protein PYDG_00048 [Pseudoalteromonas phage pYD6-A]AGH57579.1 hypothetical protein PYDG_00048 [Pseudoalteromonas phage pYD6-A]
MAYPGRKFIDTISRSVRNLKNLFIRVLAVSTNEAYTAAGVRFSQQFDEIFGNSETKYFLYELPIGSTVAVGLQQRLYKSRDGATEIEILWNSTELTGRIPNDVYNEYNKYAVNDTNQFRVSEISVPATEGDVRETDFITASGTGNNTSGGVSADVGYRIYHPGTFFIAKVTNLEDKPNRIILGYSWIEISEDIIDLT